MSVDIGQPRHPWSLKLLALVHKDGAGRLLWRPSDLALFLAQGRRLTSGEQLLSLIGDLIDLATLMEGQGSSPEATKAFLDDLVLPLAAHLRAVAHGEIAMQARAGEVERQVVEKRAALERTHGPQAGLKPARPGAGFGLRQKRP